VTVEYTTNFVTNISVLGFEIHRAIMKHEQSRCLCHGLKSQIRIFRILYLCTSQAHTDISSIAFITYYTVL